GVPASVPPGARGPAPTRVVSSAGQSVWFTPRRSGVRAPHDPPMERPLTCTDSAGSGAFPAMWAQVEHDAGPERRTRGADSAPMNATSNLIRAAVGWTYPDPGACDCGERAAMQGWAFCRCLGAGGGGHPQWRCRACDRARVLGCVGAVPVAND